MPYKVNTQKGNTPKQNLMVTGWLVGAILGKDRSGEVASGLLKEKSA